MTKKIPYLGSRSFYETLKISQVKEPWKKHTVPEESRSKKEGLGTFIENDEGRSRKDVTFYKSRMQQKLDIS